MFEGGDPEVSYEESPTVCYDTEGDYNVTLTAYSPAGGTTISKTNYVTVDNCITSFNAVELLNNSKVLHNNINSSLMVEISNYSDQYTLIIYNVSGKVIVKTQGVVGSSHDISNLKKGIYLVKVSYGKNEINQKILTK